jgi:hypothetical protein
MMISQLIIHESSLKIPEKMDDLVMIGEPSLNSWNCQVARQADLPQRDH